VGTTDRTLYEELGELTRYVETTVRKLQAVEAPVAASSEQLPAASEHLCDLSRLTEEGAHRVMGLAEQIQDNRERVAEALDALAARCAAGAGGAELADRIVAIRLSLAEDDRRLVGIVTACSFQDLVAQRVKKILGILDDIQHRLLQMIVVFGLAQRGGRAGAEGRAGELLRQLEASRSTALEQNLVDDILGQFGFS
jgi:chemotaxis protein CheZ